MDLLLAFIISMIVTMTLIPPLMRAAASFHILDHPGERKVHSGAVPCVGGLAMAFGALLPLVLWLPMDRLLAAYLVSALLLVVMGVWDDRANLSASTKFAAQFVAVLLAVFVGHVSIDSLTFTERVDIPYWLSVPLSVLFLLGVTNAINLSDGLDGLAGGTTMLACCALAVLGLTMSVPFVTIVALVVIGSILGFLRFNTYPARIFMGDGGSQFLGFTCGVLAIVLTQHEGVPLSAALPLLILGLPILDTLSVMTMRIRRGQSPFKADRTHIHHKLLSLGFDHHEAVSIIYLAQACLFGFAWVLRFESDLLILGVFGGFACAVVSTLLVADRSAWRVRSREEARQPTNLARLRKWFGEREKASNWTFWLASVCASSYAGCIVLNVSPFPRDVGWLACILVIVLAPATVSRLRTPNLEWAAQAALYVAIAVAVYLDHGNTRGGYFFYALKWIIFPGLALAVAVRMRLSKERRFEVTTLDVLLIVIAVMLPNLPGLLSDTSNVGLGIAKLVALFYGVEMVSNHSARSRVVAWQLAALFCCSVVVCTFWEGC